MYVSTSVVTVAAIAFVNIPVVVTIVVVATLSYIADQALTLCPSPPPCQPVASIGQMFV
jgi:hypothetical protein